MREQADDLVQEGPLDQRFKTIFGVSSVQQRQAPMLLLRWQRGPRALTKQMEDTSELGHGEVRLQEVPKVASTRLIRGRLHIAQI